MSNTPIFGTGSTIAEATPASLDNDSLAITNVLDVEKTAIVTFMENGGSGFCRWRYYNH